MNAKLSSKMFKYDKDKFILINHFLANGRFFGNNQVKEIFIAMWGYKEAKMQIQGYPLLLF